MKTPIVLSLMFMACASQQSVVQPPRDANGKYIIDSESATSAPNTDPESVAADYFKKGLEAETLCEKASMFETAVNESPDTKSGKLAASHLKRINAKYDANIKKTVNLYRDMVKAGYSGDQLATFRANIAVQTYECSYRPAVDRMEKALDDAAEKYRGKNVTY